MIWREKRVLLIVLGVLLLANTLFFFTYRIQYESRLRDLDARLDSVKADLEGARRSRVAAEQQVAAYRKIERTVRDIYENRWSTEQQRLTRMIAEVKKLAAAASLTPASFAFDRVEDRASARTATGATQVGVGFTVQGTYQQIRSLINQFELSEQFIIVDSISLSSENGDLLTMNIHVKTLFRGNAPAARPRAVNQDL